MGYGNAPSILKERDVFSKIRAVLVVTSDTAAKGPDAQRKRDELASLCENIGISVVGWQYFTIRQFNSATYLGTGQFRRLIEFAQEQEANIIVFNNPIQTRIQRNLETIGKICVVDRQEIILQIFASNAQSREARLQVELAQLQYSLPRLTRKWADLSQQRGGVKGSKGSGEKQLELDRRTAENRINRLKKEISEIESQRSVQRKNRTQNSIFNVAIVGYTNSGKSTLLNRISDADVLSEDKLFATLDPTTRRVFMPDGSTVLFTDTVGFVSDLPHELVDAFKSTLEEAVLADVLLIVLDASREDFLSCWDTTRKVLTDLKAFDKPRLVVLNKMDLVEPENLFALEEFELSSKEQTIRISVKTDSDMFELLNRINELLGKKRL